MSGLGFSVDVTLAQEQDLSFLLLKLDVHAETEEKLVPYLGNLKIALAKAIGLRFETDVDHLVSCVCVWCGCVWCVCVCCWHGVGMCR